MQLNISDVQVAPSYFQGDWRGRSSQRPGLRWARASGALNWVSSPLLVAIALSATSLGLIVPVLKDAGRADSPVGQTTIAGSSVADSSAIVLLDLVLLTSGGGVGEKLVLLVMFAALVSFRGAHAAAGGSFDAARDCPGAHSGRHGGDPGPGPRYCSWWHSWRWPGIWVWRRSSAPSWPAPSSDWWDRDSSTHPHFRIKLDAIGYGFLIPVFFISSGVRLDLSGPAGQSVSVDPGAVVPARPAACPGRAGAAVDPPPGLVLQSAASGLLQATSLRLIVTAAPIGVAGGLMTPVTAAALVCAGLLSVLIFPVLALGLLRSAPTPRNETPVGSDASRTRRASSGAT